MSAPHIHPLDKCFTRNDEFALYDRVVSYAELLHGVLEDVQRHGPPMGLISDRIIAALAKNPNPAGPSTEASAGNASEASGAGGAGTV